MLCCVTKMCTALKKKTIVPVLMIDWISVLDYANDNVS